MNFNTKFKSEKNIFKGRGDRGRGKLNFDKESKCEKKAKKTKTKKIGGEEGCMWIWTKNPNLDFYRRRGGGVGGVNCFFFTKIQI